MNRYKDRGVSFTYAPDGKSYFGKYDLTGIPHKLTAGFTHSVCSHPHTTPNAALTCARKKRADLRARLVAA